jgi:hypothetical protein
MTGRPLRSSSWTFVRPPIFEHSAPLFYGSLTHNLQWIFLNTHVSGVKKADNSENVAAGGIINRRTHNNSLCRDKNKH